MQKSKESDKKSIDIIYLARGIDWGIETVKNFLESYKKHPSGYKHNLIIAAKAWETKPEEYAQLEELAKENNAKILDLPDDGLDFAAYYRVAIQSKADCIFCLATTCRILQDNWLLTFMDVLNADENIKLLGPGGSWERVSTPFIYLKALFSSALRKLPFPKSKNNISASNSKQTANKKHLKEKLKRQLQEFKFNMIDNFPLPRFPNYHIRTSAFLINRELYIEFMKKKGLPKDKYAAFMLESGRANITRFVFNKGFKAGVVGADKVMYEKNEWDKSKTFRSPDTSNLIIAEKQSLIYDDSNIDTRRLLEKAAWGKKLS